METPVIRDQLIQTRTTTEEEVVLPVITAEQDGHVVPQRSSPNILPFSYPLQNVGSIFHRSPVGRDVSG